MKFGREREREETPVTRAALPHPPSGRWGGGMLDLEVSRGRWDPLRAPLKFQLTLYKSGPHGWPGIMFLSLILQNI